MLERHTLSHTSGMYWTAVRDADDRHGWQLGLLQRDVGRPRLRSGLVLHLTSWDRGWWSKQMDLRDQG